MANLRDEELKLVSKIDRYLVQNDLPLLFDQNEILESIAEVKVLSDLYADIHFQLKDQLGDGYPEAYPAYEEYVEKLNNYVTNGRREILSLRALSSKSKSVDIENKLRSEEKLFRIRMTQEIDGFIDENSDFIDPLRNQISSAQNFLSGYTDIFMRIKDVGAGFEAEFGDTFENEAKKVNTFIKLARIKINKLKTTELQNKEQHDILIRDEQYKAELTSKISICENLYRNINARISSLRQKCLNVSTMSDSEVLDARKDFHLLDSGYNEILDRTTKLCETSSPKIQATNDLVLDVERAQNDLLRVINAFKEDVADAISSRDLSYEKLKNASTLGIKLPIFTGYDSSVDYYTFKSDFERLVATRIQASLLPHYLRNNYLGGQALQLVKEIDDLPTIWERLKTSYGNVQTLMSIQMGGIERGTPLSKIKGDDQIIKSVLKL